MEASRTVVVSDTQDFGSTAPAVRDLTRLVRAEPAGTGVVLVTCRSLPLPSALAQRVRRVRVRTPDEVGAHVDALVLDDAGAVVRQLGPRAGSGRAGRTGRLACLIVKDEEEVLEACLAAVTPFVDEVVVYDTGSSDRTVELARRAGATVVEGYWDDHFGNARNRALEHCTREWVLSVDADEVVVGDPAALRAHLRREAADLVPVLIVNTSWQGGTEGYEIRPRRLFRRERCRWTGALHEYLVAAPTNTKLTASREQAPLRILHSGYQATTMQEKDKAERNVGIAKAAVEALGALDATDSTNPELSVVLSAYGRALSSAGRDAEGVDVLERVRVLGGNPSAVVQAGRAALLALARLRRTAEAEPWLATLAEQGESRGGVALARAEARLAAGDPAGAEEALRELPAGAADTDLWGSPFDPAAAESVRVAVDLALGRADAALGRLRELLRDRPQSVSLPQLVAVMDASGAPWAEVLADSPEVFLDRSLRDVVTSAPPVALRWCEAFAAAHPRDYRPVVAGSVVAGRSDLLTAVTWAARAREAGIDAPSPLRAFAEAPGRHPVERGVALAVLADAFGEAQALADLVALVPTMGPDETALLQRRCAEVGVDVRHDHGTTQNRPPQRTAVR